MKDIIVAFLKYAHIIRSFLIALLSISAPGKRDLKTVGEKKIDLFYYNIHTGSLLTSKVPRELDFSNHTLDQDGFLSLS